MPEEETQAEVMPPEPKPEPDTSREDGLERDLGKLHSRVCTLERDMLLLTSTLALVSLVVFYFGLRWYAENVKVLP